MDPLFTHPWDKEKGTILVAGESNAIGNSGVRCSRSAMGNSSRIISGVSLEMCRGKGVGAADRYFSPTHHCHSTEQHEYRHLSEF